MYSLSTSWNASGHKSGIEIINEIREIGFDTVELGFALTEETVREILTLKNKGAISISSLHNMCPLPPEVPPEKASPDFYSLSSLDDKERNAAIKAAKNTIDYAGLFGARAVVFHVGRVEIKERIRELASLSDDKRRFDTVKKEMVDERSSKKDPYVKKAAKSLEEIVPYAKKAGIAPAIENRYYYREIPLIEEFEEIFTRFRKGDLFYWHDVGHAEVFTRLGLARHRDFLEKFSDRLLGVHLHDIIHMIEDHRAPGMGTFDFRELKKYIRKDTIKVIEAHQPATGSEIRRSVEYLNKIFLA